jgi:hypothetical protein
MAKEPQIEKRGHSNGDIVRLGRCVVIYLLSGRAEIQIRGACAEHDVGIDARDKQQARQ